MSMYENIKLDYPVNIRVDGDIYHCRNGAEFFMDEHGVQWVKFVPSNGYAAGDEHITRTTSIIVIKTNKKATAAP